MYAVLETGGKQYRVQAGDILFIEKLDVEADEKVSFDKILMVSDDSGLKIGKPYVDGAKVEATVIKNGKSKKVLMMRYKAKKGVRIKRGHRQHYTKVKIDSIGA